MSGEGAGLAAAAAEEWEEGEEKEVEEAVLCCMREQLNFPSISRAALKS